MAINETIIINTLLQLAVILFAARLSGFLFEKLNHSRVIGEVVAGIILGASFFGFIEADNQILLFLAQLGLVAHMFQVGVESNLHELVHQRKNSIIVGLVSSLFPLGVTFFLMQYIGFDPINSFFIGAVLSVTSIDFAISTLREQNKMKSKEGNMILGASIVNNIIGLVFLASINEIIINGAIDTFKITRIMLTAILFFLAVIYFAKKFESRLLDVVHTFKEQRMLYAYSFIFALAMAYLAAGIGLTIVIGAFAAGLLLEREEYKEHVTERTSVLTKIFAPVFFVMAGVPFDLFELLTPETIPILLSLSLIAIVTKLFSGFGVVGTGASKLTVGAGMLPMGELGFIFATFGLGNGLVEGSVYSAIVGAIIITTIITYPLLNFCVECEKQRIFAKFPILKGQ